MQSRKKMERFITGIEVATDAGRDREIFDDVLQAHRDSKQRHSPRTCPRKWRTAMRYKPTRIAAVLALAVLLVGVFGLGSGAVAFSQVGRTVNMTLDHLRELIMGPRTGGAGAPAPRAPAAGDNPDVQAPTSGVRVIMCTARFFAIAAGDEAVSQSLKDQGIELVKASTDPEVSYAALGREQAESFDASLTLKCLGTSRILVREGETAAVATTKRQEPRGLALGWQPTVSSDGKEIRSALSFHDGRNGFEIPNIGTESGGVVLVRVQGMFWGQDDDNEPGDGPQEVLLRVQVDLR
jgi:hypothetical protein